MKGKAICCTALLLGGCAAMPDSLLLEEQHTSHLSQHAGDQWADHQPGFDSVGAAVKWQRGAAYVKAGEYYTFECLDKRHEVFQAAFGLEIKLK